MKQFRQWRCMRRRAILLKQYIHEWDVGLVVYLYDRKVVQLARMHLNPKTFDEGKVNPNNS